MSENFDRRNYAQFPVRLTDNQLVAMLMGIAGLGALLLSYYYDSLEGSSDSFHSDAKHHQHHSVHKHSDVWTQLRSQGLTETLRTNRTFGISVFIGGLFLLYSAIFYLIISEERYQRKVKKNSYQDTDLSQNEAESPCHESIIESSPSPVKPRTILKKSSGVQDERNFQTNGLDLRPARQESKRPYERSKSRQTHHLDSSDEEPSQRKQGLGNKQPTF